MSKQCKNCGADLPEDASFCPRCAQSQIERQEIKPPRLWRKKALIAAGCVLALAAALCLSLAVRGRKNGASVSSNAPANTVFGGKDNASINGDAPANAAADGKDDASISGDAPANAAADGKDNASVSGDAPANTVADGKDDASVSGDTPANIVVDGKEISAKDFLIAYLSAYIQSDAYLARTAEFEKESAQEAPPFAVTYAFELKVNGWGNENQPLHFFMVKATCASFADGAFYDSVTMAIDYDTGVVYDRYSVDESWMEKSEKEQAIYIAAEGGCFKDNYYSGEPIFVDSETHISLSDSDIAEINQALHK